MFHKTVSKSLGEIKKFRNSTAIFLNQKSLAHIWSDVLTLTYISRALIHMNLRRGGWGS